MAVISHPRARWTLWQWGPGAVTWVFIAEPLVIAWVVAETIQEEVGRGDLIRLALFLTCGLAHAYFTRESEERRRGAHGNATHVDQTSIWIFSAALVLPVSLVLVLIAVIRVQRWRIARKPLHKWLHTNVAIALSALCVHAVASATPLQAWVSGARPLPTTTGEMVIASACLLAAIGAYFLAQAIMVGAVRALAHRFPYGGGEPSTDDPLLVDALGTWRDNAEIVLVLLVAAAAALFHALAAPLLLLMVPIAVYTTRREQQIGELQSEVTQLIRDSTTEPKTGLANRRGFEPAAAQVLTLSRRTNRPVALLVLDLDLFKHVNDTWGHLAGDQVLAAVACTLRERTRDSDLLCRWGGEEFLVLMPETGPSDALALAERLRAAVADLKIPITKAAGGDTLILGGDATHDAPGCTMSIGVAYTPCHGRVLDDLIAHADQALYRAKRSGRNQVRVAAGGAIDRVSP